MFKKIVLGFIILVILIIAYNLIRQFFEVINSGERLSQSADVVYKLEIRNRALKEKLARIQSPDFLEEEIRNRLGFAKMGETMVIIPEEKLKLVLRASSPAPIRYPNWLGWLKVFFK